MAWTLLLYIIPFAIFGNYFGDGCLNILISEVQTTCGSEGKGLMLISGIISLMVAVVATIAGLRHRRKVRK